MSIVEFENIKVTTMTVVVNLEGCAIIEAAFPLLPITRMDLPKNLVTTKKFKIPWPGQQYAGKILSTKFVGITRGLIKTNKAKSFRNSVGIDICTSVKNVSAKLSKNKIHMCGPNSEALAIETAQHIINHLINIQKELDYINEHIPERDEVIRWLIRETKGEHFTINEETQEIIELESGEMIRNSVIYDKDGNAKYNYKEISFKWEVGDIINPDNIIVNKYGQPYYRSLTKKEKRDNITEYPIMMMDDTLKIHLEGDKIPVDEKGVKFNKVSRFPLRVMEVTSVKFPAFVLKSLRDEGKISFPKNINSRIATFLLTYIQDYAYHHVLTEFLENFKDINRVYYHNEIPMLKIGSEVSEIASEVGVIETIGAVEALEEKKPVEMTKLPLTVGRLNIAMINYSFSLGMNVDRWVLYQLIDGYKNFRATYNNTTDHHVTITVPYIPDENEIIKRKSSKSISFMVYKSGIVTQSGPSPHLMRQVYYDFMIFIRENTEKIMLKDGKPFNLKFKPIAETQILVQ
jgi:hypothetical protein